MYIHLLEILILDKRDGLDWIYSYAKENPKQEDWFYTLHKRFRQTDVYELSIKIEPLKLTEKEELRYKELSNYLKENKHDDWLNDDIYRTKLEERRHLLDKKLDEGYRSIGGHLDMLFWNLVDLDKKGVLGRIMEGLFEDLSDGMENLD